MSDAVFTMLSADRTIRITWLASGTGHNGKRTEHAVLKEKKREVAVTDHTARTQNTKKREDSRLESLLVKKRIDLIFQTEILKAYSMPVFQITDRDQKKRCFLPATIELAQKMQKSFPIFVICKERYCQT